MRDEPTSNREGGTERANAHSVQRFVSPHGRTHLDLFSGIGGFALAAASAGFKTIGFSEIEPYSCAVLKKHWPEIKNYGDIRNIRNVPADLVTGGFPCQPFSVAGKRRGKEDDRHLWPEMCRVIAESKPTYVLGENVAGIISMELDRVLSDLENLGYAAWPLVIPACAVDARHRRDRVWIAAYATSDGRDGWNNQRRGCDSHHQNRDATPDEPEWIRGVGRAGATGETDTGGILADAAQRQDHGRNGSGVDETEGRGESLNAATHARRENVADSASQREREPADQANPVADFRDARQESRGGSRWLPEPGMGRVANGIPNRAHRLRGLGNAIVPQVAAEILKNLVRANRLL